MLATPIARDLAKTAAMDAAWDEMHAAANKFDGSYERARDRLRQLQSTPVNLVA